MQWFLIALVILIRSLVLYEVSASIVVLDKGLVSLQRNSIGLQFYIDIENKDSLSTCAVHSWSKDCCLTDGEEDCNTMSVYGGYHLVEPKDRETLIFVYPSLYQHDQVGHCDFVLDYKCGGKRNKRQNVDVIFDTRIYPQGKTANSLLEHYVESQKIPNCDSLDQDSLHNCEPVDCDMKYGGEKSYYDGYAEKCVEASLCESNPDSELPEIVYVPSTNTCRDLEHPLTVSDIYAISTGTGVVAQPRNAEDVKVVVRSNCTTISQNLRLIRDMMYGKLCPLIKSDTSEYKDCCKSAAVAIVSYIGSVCALLLALFCCIQTTTWLHRKLMEQEFSNFVENFKNMFKAPARSYYEPTVNSEVRKTLLREVIVRDIPMELRDSIVNICERMDKKVKKKKRYRSKDIGSQINLGQVQYDVRASTATSSTTSLIQCDEGQTLLK